MTKLLSALVGVSMLGLASAASAAEPVALSDAQLDSVTAGFLNFNSGIGANTVGAAQNIVPIGVGKLKLVFP